MGAPKFWGPGAVGPLALGQKRACSRGRDPPAGGQLVRFAGGGLLLFAGASLYGSRE